MGRNTRPGDFPHRLAVRLDASRFEVDWHPRSEHDPATVLTAHAQQHLLHLLASRGRDAASVGKVLGLAERDASRFMTGEQALNLEHVLLLLLSEGLSLLDLDNELRRCGSGPQMLLPAPYRGLLTGAPGGPLRFGPPGQIDWPGALVFLRRTLQQDYSADLRHLLTDDDLLLRALIALDSASGIDPRLAERDGSGRAKFTPSSIGPLEARHWSDRHPVGERQLGELISAASAGPLTAVLVLGPLAQARVKAVLPRIPLDGDGPFELDEHSVHAADPQSTVARRVTGRVDAGGTVSEETVLLAIHFEKAVETS